TSGSTTPARLAICRVVVASKPCSANNELAASRIRRRTSSVERRRRGGSGRVAVTAATIPLVERSTAPFLALDSMLSSAPVGALTESSMESSTELLTGPFTDLDLLAAQFRDWVGHHAD